MCSPTLMEPRFRSSKSHYWKHTHSTPNPTRWGIRCLGVVAGWALLPLVSLSPALAFERMDRTGCVVLSSCVPQGSSLGKRQMTDQGHLASELVAETPGSIRANVRDAPWSYSPDWRDCRPLLPVRFMSPRPLECSSSPSIMPHRSVVCAFTETLPGGAAFGSMCPISVLSTLPAIHTVTLLARFTVLPPPGASSLFFFSLCSFSLHDVLNPYRSTDPTAVHTTHLTISPGASTPDIPQAPPFQPS